MPKFPYAKFISYNLMFRGNDIDETKLKYDTIACIQNLENNNIISSFDWVP